MQLIGSCKSVHSTKLNAGPHVSVSDNCDNDCVHSTNYDKNILKGSLRPCFQKLGAKNLLKPSLKRFLTTAAVVKKRYINKDVLHLPNFTLDRWAPET